MDKLEAKQQMLKAMLGTIKDEAMQVKDSTISDRDKLEKANVLLNIMYYVQNYNEYTQVIAEYKRKKSRLMGREI